MKKIAIIALISLFINYAQAQEDKLKTAFATSLGFENKANYSSAISKMMEVYSNTSYEINLRLGWLHYCAGSQKESKQSIPVQSVPI